MVQQTSRICNGAYCFKFTLCFRVFIHSNLKTMLILYNTYFLKLFDAPCNNPTLNSIFQLLMDIIILCTQNFSNFSNIMFQTLKRIGISIHSEYLQIPIELSRHISNFYPSVETHCIKIVYEHKVQTSPITVLYP